MPSFSSPYPPDHPSAKGITSVLTKPMFLCAGTVLAALQTKGSPLVVLTSAFCGGYYASCFVDAPETCSSANAKSDWRGVLVSEEMQAELA